jgi:TatD DNase family protein
MKKRPAPPVLTSNSQLIDSHCHLDMAPYQNDLEQVLASAGKHGVNRIITIGIDLASSRKAVKLAERYAGVYATVGIHPHSAEEASPEVYQELRELASRPKVVAFGEIGLDYAKQYAPVEAQRREFARQLALAGELHLPVVIHDREAHQDTLALLRQTGPFRAGGVVHCFSGDVSLARQVLELGFYISIPGIVTFKNSTALQQVVKEVPLERLLLETDGPFLAPVPWRGKSNRPEYLLYTAARVAELKNISIDEVADQTMLNTIKLFSLPQEESVLQ